MCVVESDLNIHTDNNADFCFMHPFANIFLSTLLAVNYFLYFYNFLAYFLFLSNSASASVRLSLSADPSMLDLDYSRTVLLRMVVCNEKEISTSLSQ